MKPRVRPDFGNTKKPMPTQKEVDAAKSRRRIETPEALAKFLDGKIGVKHDIKLVDLQLYVSELNMMKRALENKSLYVIIKERMK